MKNNLKNNNTYEQTQNSKFKKIVLYAFYFVIAFTIISSILFLGVIVVTNIFTK
jgi:uncharacterized membrane protein